MLNFKSQHEGKNTHLRNKGERNQNQPYKETMPQKNANVETLTLSSKAVTWTMRLKINALDTDMTPKRSRIDGKHKSHKSEKICKNDQFHGLLSLFGTLL